MSAFLCYRGRIFSWPIECGYCSVGHKRRRDDEATERHATRLAHARRGEAIAFHAASIANEISRNATLSLSSVVKAPY